MCGIAGYFSRSAAPPAAVAPAMCEALKRRGPDGQHIVGWDADWQPVATAPAHALVHARLAIIDPRPVADQPMRNEAGDIWLCYNGEVYGWQDDARQLAAKGVTFKTHSDSEFILRAYEAWGIDGLLPRLRGMFAFAIIDLRQQQVWLARDRMGLKPMIYSIGERGLAFGSTVRAVLPWLTPDQRRFDPAAIDAYLAHRYVPAPRTIFAGMQRLENGRLLRYDLQTGASELKRYWFPAPEQTDWREALDEAIRLRTVADRPVGVFLSSGVDSVVVASRLAAQGFHQLQAFSAAFPGSRFDESADAAKIAQQIGLPHRSVAVPLSLKHEFVSLVADLDEPFADPSAPPTWFLARETVKEVTVVLGGDGGDELLAGYKRIDKHLRSRWRAGWRLPLPAMASMAHKGWPKIAAEMSVCWQDAYAMRFSGFTPPQRRALQPSFDGQPPHYWRAPDQTWQDPLQRLLEIDLANYLPEYILRKGDLATMAHGLELRAPLLDHRFYQSLLALPPAQRFAKPAKSLLRPLVADLGPLDPFARKKRGFNPPLHDWLRHDLADRLPGLGARLHDLTSQQLTAAAVDGLIASYLAGEEAYAEQVLQLLVLDESLAQLRALAGEVGLG